ncbi:MAG: esterase/lipase family protein [Woeseia sp.]
MHKPSRDGRIDRLSGLAAGGILILMLFSHGSAAATSDCVVLLHGLARTAASMDDMAEALTEGGYRVVNVDYPSRDYKIEKLAPMAIGKGLTLCGDTAAEGQIHFVTHSLGGILVRYYLEEEKIVSLGRVVMLAPPNQGSHAADAMQGVPGFDWLNGPAGKQLGKGDDSVPLKLGPPDFEFAVIAGNRTIDPVTSAVLEDPDDGKVTVEDTKLEGMRDFAVVPASHAYVMTNRIAIRLVLEFLANGKFGDGG